MIDFKEKSNSDSLNQSESDEGDYLEKQIKEYIEQGSSEEKSAERPVMSDPSFRQEENFIKEFENEFFPNALSFNSRNDRHQPALPPGLGAADTGFPREAYSFGKDILQQTFSFPAVATEPLDTFSFPIFPQKDRSRFAHIEPESNRAAHLKSKLKLQSQQFKPEDDVEQNDQLEPENIEENQETQNFENHAPSKEILDSPPEPENEGSKEIQEPETKNPYAEKILSKREIEERKRKKAEAEAAIQKHKVSEIVKTVPVKPVIHVGDETPNHEHKNEKSESLHDQKHLKNATETPKNQQKGWSNENKMAKSSAKSELHVQPTKPHFQEHNPAKHTIKKDDSFKQSNTKHKKGLSVPQDKEPEVYIEKKNVPAAKEEIDMKPKIAGVNKFNKFELLVGNQSSASSESNDSNTSALSEENEKQSQKQKNTSSPKKAESKQTIAEEEDSTKKKKKKKNKKNKNKTVTDSKQNLDDTPVANPIIEKEIGKSQQEIKEVDEKQKTPSDEAPESNEEIKISSKTAKNKKKKAAKNKKKKNASSIQALDDEDKKVSEVNLKGEECNKNPNLKGKGSPDSDLSQVSEVGEEMSVSKNAKRTGKGQTLRDIQEDPSLISQGFLFIPSRSFYDDLIKSMKFVD